MEQPFAIMVTNSADDLMTAVEIAAKARAAGAVIQTPFVHTPTHKQVGRANATAKALVAVICNDIVTIIDKEADVTCVKSIAEASEMIAASFAKSQARKIMSIANDNHGQAAIAI